MTKSAKVIKNKCYLLREINMRISDKVVDVSKHDEYYDSGDVFSVRHNGFRYYSKDENYTINIEKGYCVVLNDRYLDEAIAKFKNVIIENNMSIIKHLSSQIEKVNERIKIISLFNI